MASHIRAAPPFQFAFYDHFILLLPRPALDGVGWRHESGEIRPPAWPARRRFPISSASKSDFSFSVLLFQRLPSNFFIISSKRLNAPTSAPAGFGESFFPSILNNRNRYYACNEHAISFPNAPSRENDARNASCFRPIDVRFPPNKTGTKITKNHPSVPWDFHSHHLSRGRGTPTMIARRNSEWRGT